MRPALSTLLPIVHEAGRSTLRFFGRPIVTQAKADRSPVTEADLASQDILTRELSALRTGWAVISEEGPHSTPPDVGPFWLVDPLDGTKEFIKGTPEFTVNVALVEDGSPVLGVVHAPASGLTYFAETGRGAFRGVVGGAVEAVRVRRAEQHIAVVASKDHAGPLVAQMLERLPGATLKSVGSSLKFCLVAEGAADLYLRDLPTMEWDTAAAQCIVEAAGGSVCTLDGQPLRYGKPGLKNPSIITCGDPGFQLRDLLARHNSLEAAEVMRP